MATIAHHTGHAANRLVINRIGLWTFMFSEAFLFAAVISSRYYVTGLYRPHELNQLLGLGITMVLLLSSLTAYQSEVAAAGGDEAGFRRNAWATLALGLLFTVGVGIEWAEAFHAFPPSQAFGSLFFTLTGLHAFHVLSGLVVIALVLRRWRPTTGGGYWPVEGAVKYWHFVDVVWVVIYPTLYLVG